MNRFNVAYEINKRRAESIENIRKEYLTWIIHLFGTPDPKEFARIMKMTFKDVELYMELRIRERVADKARAKKKEEDDQRALLEKLKRQMG